ncbi:hypothetical protein T484DRAFT_1779837 [Baffinella frigidus]|nr:hypothetical protein T484DRAFT_1779837 [Cryptophyta sp. CCMP2293]
MSPGRWGPGGQIWPQGWAVHAVLGGGASGVMADGEQGGAQKPPGEAGKKTKGFGRTLVDGMLAGAVAGAAVDLALYPLDTVKTRLQTKTGAPSFQELYSGLSASLAGHVPSSALFFAVYQTSKVYVLEGGFGGGSAASQFIASGRVYVLEGVFGGGSAASQLIASGLGNIAASTIRVGTISDEFDF